MVPITNDQTGHTEFVPVGFSWTTLFFGFFPALFRGDVAWAAIMFVVAMLTGGLSWFVFPFFYNKVYLNGMIQKGYRHGFLDANPLR